MPLWQGPTYHMDIVNIFVEYVRRSGIVIMDKINTSHISGKHVFFMPTHHHHHRSGTTVRYVLRPPAQSSYNLVDLGYSLAKLWCSSSKGPPPHPLFIFSWSSFYPAMKFFIQDIFEHTVSPPTTPPGFDRSDNVSMAQDGLDFLVWSYSPFSIQKEGSIDSADRFPMLTPNCRKLNHLRHRLLHGR
jgi:hypothetical protein